MVAKQVEPFPHLTARFYGYYDSFCGTQYIKSRGLSLMDGSFLFQNERWFLSAGVAAMSVWGNGLREREWRGQTE